MNAPPISHPRWAEILQGKRAAELKFLGAKLTLGRLKASVASNPASLPTATTELRDFFAKLEHLPNVQADLQSLFG